MFNILVMMIIAYIGLGIVERCMHIFEFFMRKDEEVEAKPRKKKLEE